MKYRPDIDGIRAIAVLLVLFYHAHFPVIASGFIGVDIFFVISGFLITNIIVSEINTTGKFRFINFYKKRLWRLMPVLIALSIILSIVCAIFYLPSDFIEFTRSLKSTVRFTSNQFFSNIVGGYFSPNINTLPLVHTWSLSIEWQFYALLPFSLFCLIKAFKTKYLPLAIAILWLGFLILAFRLSEISPTKTYYFLSSRIFELLTGSLLAVLPLNTLFLNILSLNTKTSITTAHSSNINASNINASNQIKNILLNIIFSTLGIISLGTIAFIALQKEILIGFPNYYALAICIATAVLIAIGQIHPRNLITQILSFKPLVGIGLISYSLYIWHWPIFAVLRYISIEETLSITLSALTFTFFLAVCSWYFLERPARKFNQTSMKITLAILVIIPFIVSFGMTKYAKKYDGFPKRFGEKTIHIEKTNAEFLNKNREKCLGKPYLEDKYINVSLNDPACLSGQLSTTNNTNTPNNIDTRKAFVIGDSFANHLWGFIDVLAKDANTEVRSKTMAACMTAPNLLQRSPTGKGVYKECIAYIKEVYEEIANHHYDYVILGQSWVYIENIFLNTSGETIPAKESRQLLEDSIDAGLQIIIASGAIPVIFENTVVDFKDGDNQCFYKNIKLHQTSMAACEGSAEDFKTNPIIREIFKKMQSKYTSLIVIDPKKVQCPGSKCLAEINGIPVYSVGAHITDYTSISLGQDYLKRFGNPFRKDIKNK